VLLKVCADLPISFPFYCRLSLVTLYHLLTLYYHTICSLSLQFVLRIYVKQFPHFNWITTISKITNGLLVLRLRLPHVFDSRFPIRHTHFTPLCVSHGITGCGIDLQFIHTKGAVKLWHDIAPVCHFPLAICNLPFVSQLPIWLYPIKVWLSVQIAWYLQNAVIMIIFE